MRLPVLLLGIIGTFQHLVSATQQPHCVIEPPYNQIALVKLSIPPTHSLWPQLNAICELHFVDDDASHRSAVLLTRAQLSHAQTHLPRSKIKIIVPNLLTHFSTHSDDVAPYTGTDEPTRYRSYQYATLDDSFHLKLRPLASHQQRWQYIARAHPRTVRLEVIGKSVENRDIHLLRIGSTSPHAPRRVLLLFGQHAREWASVASATYVAEVLAAYPARGIEVLLVPLVNPDGYHYSMAHDRLWRKNRARTTPCAFSPLHSGVDLNRNWGVDFAGPHTTARDPCSPVYHGQRAFSEPETAAVRRLNTTGLRAFLDVHSYSQLLVGPWAYSDTAPPRARDVDVIGRRLEAAASAGGSPYTYGRGRTNGMYLASGVASDWYFQQGALASFTLELRPDRNDPLGFEIAPHQILPTARDALNVASELIAYAAGGTTLRTNEDPPKDDAPPVAMGASPSTSPSASPRPVMALQTSSWVLPVLLGCVGAVILVVAIVGTMVVMRRRRDGGIGDASTTGNDTA